MSIEVRSLGELGAFSLPVEVEVLLAPLIPKYKAEIRKHNAWLEQKGHEIVRSILPTGSTKKKKGKQAPSPPKLVDQLLDPVLAPFAKGAKDEVMKLVLPVTIALTATLAGSFFLGRLSVRRRG